MNVLEEYDFFANQRKAHLEALEGEKKKEKDKRRAKVREQSLAWTKDGKEALNNVISHVHNLKYMLQPHNMIRESMKLIEEYRNIVQNYYFNRASLAIGQKIISLINNDRNPLKHKTKTNLMTWKRVVLLQLIQHYREKYPFQDGVILSSKRKLDLSVTRKLMRIYGNYIPIDAKTRKQLRKKRDELRRANAKWDLIQRTMAACEFIGHCKSIQHNNPKGCSNCGVIYLGGTLNGATPYVKSVSRDTGVATLVTLEFEMQTLKQEEETQEKVLQRVNMELDAMEEIILNKVRINMQVFWSFVLQYKRTKRDYQRLQKSKFYYRVRRLVVMKKEIDLRIKEPVVITLDEYRDKYFDMIRELEEYIDLQNRLKFERILSYARRFHHKLKVIVDDARERRYQEWLRMQSMPPPPKPIVIKKLEANPTIERFICYRIECNCRKFLTKERFDIHMKTHQESDLKRKQQLAANESLRNHREKEELSFLNTVEHAKKYIDQQHLSKNNHVKSDREIHIDDDHAIDELLNEISSTTSLITMSSFNDNPINATREQSPMFKSPNQRQRSIVENVSNNDENVNPLTTSKSYSTLPRENDQSSLQVSLSMHSLSLSASTPYSPNISASKIPSSSSKAKLLSSAGKLLLNDIGSERSVSWDVSRFTNNSFISPEKSHDLGAKIYQNVRVQFNSYTQIEFELISKQTGVTAPSKCNIQRECTNFGRDENLCDFVLSSRSTESVFNDIHCIIYRVEDISNDRTTLKIIDNKSRYGTYLVNNQSVSSVMGAMALKVSSNLGKASVLEDGTLLCIAVTSVRSANESAMLPANEASAAAVVYRVHIKN